MNRDWALKTVRVLDRVVAVIPCASILSCNEDIGHTVLWCNRALGYSIDTIHVHGLVLFDAVPVDACTIVSHIIDNRNVDSLY